MDKNVIKREYNKILAFTETVVYLIYSSNLTQLNINISSNGNIEVTPYDDMYDDLERLFTINVSEKEKEDTFNSFFTDEHLVNAGFSEEEIETYKMFVAENKLCIDLNSLKLYDRFLYNVFFEYVLSNIYNLKYRDLFETKLNEIVNYPPLIEAETCKKSNKLGGDYYD